MMNITDEFDTPRKARIEIIPLIDVVFFLLATFVLFTLSLQKISVVPVDLPVSGRTSDEDTTLYIQTSEEGTLYVRIGTRGAAEPIAAEELPQRLRAYLRSTGDPRVFVRSDTKAKFGAGIMVLDEVRKAGIKKVSVETMSSKTGT